MSYTYDIGDVIKEGMKIVLKTAITVYAGSAGTIDPTVAAVLGEGAAAVIGGLKRKPQTYEQKMDKILIGSWSDTLSKSGLSENYRVELEHIFDVKTVHQTVVALYDDQESLKNQIHAACRVAANRTGRRPDAFKLERESKKLSSEFVRSAAERINADNDLRVISMLDIAVQMNRDNGKYLVTIADKVADGDRKLDRIIQMLDRIIKEMNSPDNSSRQNHKISTSTEPELFLPRNNLIVKIEEALEQCRIVMISGFGGTGKSELARELRRDMLKIMTHMRSRARITGRMISMNC